jgi:hypothetical protein
LNAVARRRFFQLSRHHFASGGVKIVEIGRFERFQLVGDRLGMDTESARDLYKVQATLAVTEPDVTPYRGHRRICSKLSNAFHDPSGLNH